MPEPLGDHVPLITPRGPSGGTLPGLTNAVLAEQSTPTSLTSTARREEDDFGPHDEQAVLACGGDETLQLLPVMDEPGGHGAGPDLVGGGRIRLVNAGTAS